MRRDYDFSRGKRGAVVPVPSGKRRITIRLDHDILAWFRGQVHAAGGGSYQTLINSALKEYVSQRREPLEDTLRRVLREELPGSGYPGARGRFRLDKELGPQSRARTKRRKRPQRRPIAGPGGGG